MGTDMSSKKKAKETSRKDGSKYINLNPTIDYTIGSRLNPRKAIKEWLEKRIKSEENTE